MTTLTEKQEQTLKQIARDSVYRTPSRIGTAGVPTPSGILSVAVKSQSWNASTLKALVRKGFIAWAIFHRDTHTVSVNTNPDRVQEDSYGKIVYVALTRKSQDFYEEVIEQRDTLQRVVEKDWRTLNSLAMQIVEESGLDHVHVESRNPTLDRMCASVDIKINDGKGDNLMTLTLAMRDARGVIHMTIGAHRTSVNMRTLDDMTTVFMKAVTLKNIARLQGVVVTE